MVDTMGCDFIDCNELVNNDDNNKRKRGSGLSLQTAIMVIVTTAIGGIIIFSILLGDMCIHIYVYNHVPKGLILKMAKYSQQRTVTLQPDVVIDAPLGNPAVVSPASKLHFFVSTTS